MHRSRTGTVLALCLLTLLPACAGRAPDHSRPGDEQSKQSRHAGQGEPLGTSDGRWEGPSITESKTEAGGGSDGIARAQAGEAFAPDRRDVKRSVAPVQDESPLATEYGERHSSSVHSVEFARAADAPDMVLALRYDAASRLGAGQFLSSGARISGMSFAGPLSLSLTDGAGEPLHAVSLNGEAFAVGRIGERYMVGIENGSGERFEAVVSVDGLDVLDGDDASYHKRGYLVAPYSSTMIEGWRTSYSEVAAFRFSAIEDGYGARTGRARNSGVVGVAFFREQAPQFVPPPPPRHDPQPDPFPGRR